MVLLATTKTCPKNNFNPPVMLRGKLTHSEIFKIFVFEDEGCHKVDSESDDSDYEPNEENAIYIHLSKTVPSSSGEV